MRLNDALEAPIIYLENLAERIEYVNQRITNFFKETPTHPKKHLKTFIKI